MHNYVIFTTILTLIISTSTESSFSILEKAVEITDQLVLCSGDVFLHEPFAQGSQDLSKFTTRTELAYSSSWTNSSWEVTGWGTTTTTAPNKRMASPSCWIIIVPITILQSDSSVQILTQLIAKISTRLNNLSHRVLKPTIVFAFSSSPFSNAQEMVTSLFQDASFSLDTNIYTLFINQNNFSLWEVYNIKTLMRVEKVVETELATLGRLDPVRSPAGRRSNFHGESLIAVIRTNQPGWMKYIGSAKAKNITLVGGFSVQLYWNFQDMLNFSTSVAIGDGLITLPNKTLGGTTASHLNSRTGDIALSMSSVVPFRASQLTFLQPTYNGIINCFFMQPTANSIRNIVTAPFSKLVWFSLLGTWLFLIMIVKISAFLKRYSSNTDLRKKLELHKNQDGEFTSQILDFGWTYENENDHWNNDNKSSGGKTKKIKTVIDKQDISTEPENNDVRFASEIGMWAFTANCQKSWHIIPDSFPMRMMFLIGILCGVVCFVGYSGAITSTLTVSTLPVKQFSDLTKFKFKFTVHEWSEPFQIFLQLMIDTQNLDQKVLKITTAEEISHLLDKRKPMAFLTYSDLFYPTAVELNYTEIFICAHISKVIVSPVLYKSGLFLKKGSEYAEILNHKIIIMKERGFNYRYIKGYETSNIFTCGNGGSGTADPIEFSDVFTAFLVACVGLTVSATLLTIEILYRKIEMNCGARRKK